MPPNDFDLQYFLLSLYQTVTMKAARFFIISFSISLIVSSCNLFKPKYGCPSDGRNVGAERVLEQTKKEQRKTKKFKA